MQAAFVDYGGNRHGFLAFSEIHPDYYQIPVADRQALIAAQERAERDAEDEHERRRGRGRNRGRGSHRRDEAVRSAPLSGETSLNPDNAQDSGPGEASPDEMMPSPAAESAHDDTSAAQAAEADHGDDHSHDDGHEHAHDHDHGHDEPHDHDHHHEDGEHEHPEDTHDHEAAEDLAAQDGVTAESAAADQAEAAAGEPSTPHPDDEAVESVGGADALEEAQERAPRVRVRQYKIQEVIKRRQVMLVQVVKEERGSKGAALTTYLSLAGRYCVLMPNTARGGGISRKITSSEDRNRLKEIAQDLEVPEGMGVILRTAGASRTKMEVKRDFEYLMRIWEQVRDLTLKSTAPKLVYEEGSLTKRSIRDLYNKDIDEIIVAGEGGYNDAKEFMRMLMPSHAKNVKLYRDSQPVFTRYGIESQLDAMFSPTVQLRSGGYIVINQTEALVAIDVNSGRATREHHIEDTATKTNSEAAEEVARQLRLRDLAGLIVIDFIDMDEGRNNRTVERRLKEALKHDRARIQVGRISHFGLMEMSRQRIRTSVLESSTEKCPTCGGSGHVRSVSSVTLALLRSIEENLIKGATHNLIVRTRPEVALYILNQKRGHLRLLEERFQINITVNADATVVGTQSFVIDRGEMVHSPDAARAIAATHSEQLPPLVDETDAAYVEEPDPEAELETEERAESVDSEVQEYAGDDEPADSHSEAGAENGTSDGEGGPRRRRRRRGGRGRGRGRDGEGREPRDNTGFAPPPLPDAEQHATAPEDHEGTDGPEDGFAQPQQSGAPGEGGDNDPNRRRRRRGRRGGRRNRHRNGEGRTPEQHGNGHTESQPGHDFGGDSAGGNDTPAYEPSSPPPQREAITGAAISEPAAQDSPQDAPRRRSTVREPAPIGQSWATTSAPSPSPQPSPSASGTTTDESGQPKRGWWGKRLLGGKD